jgi:hypothetical protein
MVDRRGSALSSGGDTEIVLRIDRAGWELWYDPAMELRHFIPRHRISHQYLCRLLHGMGQGVPYLAAMKRPGAAYFGARAHILMDSLRETAAALLAIGVYDLLWLRRASGRRVVELYHRIGYLQGALRFMRDGGPPIQSVPPPESR